MSASGVSNVLTRDVYTTRYCGLWNAIPSIPCNALSGYPQDLTLDFSKLPAPGICVWNGSIRQRIGCERVIQTISINNLQAFISTAPLNYTQQTNKMAMINV